MLKQLKEKRSALMGELEIMVTELEGGETRSLTDEEVASFDAKKKEIENIDATISRVEEMRFKDMTKEEQVVVTEERNMEELESRAMDAFFRGNELTSEQRAMLTSTAGNKATMPLTIAKGILKKLEEFCPILDKAKKFSSKGTLRLLDETTYGAGAMTAENVAFHDDDAVLSNIELTSFKITASTKVTFELLANSDVDMNQYLSDVIVRRLAREVNRKFVIGSGTQEPQGLVNAKSTVEVGKAVSVDDAIKIQTSMHPTFLTGAVWLMNRKTFTAYALLKDGNGHSYMQNAVVNGKITYTFLGHEVVIDDNMQDAGTEGNKHIILANIGECYVINLLQDIVVRRLQEVSFTDGVEIFAGYLLADGKVYNQDAIRVGVTGA